MRFSQLFQRLRGQREQCALVVEGTITDVGRHTPRTRLGPDQATEEAFFTVRVSEARSTDGREQDPSSIIPPDFSGEVALLEQFGVGDTVRITATTATGRIIASMEAIDLSRLPG